MKPNVLLGTVALAVFTLSSTASAQDQPWLKDRRYTEGPGYRVGDFELHPGASLEFGYDSNYDRLSSADATATRPIQPSLRLRLTPSFSFSTLGEQRRETAPSTSPPSVEFKGGLSATYNEFIPITSGSTIANNRNLGANVDLSLGILPGRPWSGLISASFSRILTASADGAFSSFNSGGTLNRDVPRAQAELIWTPGAGLLEWRLGYQFIGTFFEDSNVNALSNFQNQVELRGRWRFLPRTAMLFDGRFGFVSYPTTSGPPALGAPASTEVFYPKFISHPMRALLGVNGLVTPSFAVLAMIGWGASFYQIPNGLNGLPPNTPVQDFDSVIGQAELKWYLTPNPSSDPTAATLTLSSISVGFLRDFYDSYLGNTYFERDRGYLTLSYFYGGKFLIVLDGGAGPVLYPQMVSNVGAGTIAPFTNIRVDASLFAEYRFKDQFGINATFRYNENIDPNNTQIPHMAPAGVNVTPGHLSFREIEAYLGARWMM
jgi:hypothetical protein